MRTDLSLFLALMKESAK